MTEEVTDPANVISLADAAKAKASSPERTIVNNSRRYSPDACKHRGPFSLDRKLGSVECGDCGALLNPIYVLEVLAAHEAYWNERIKDLQTHLNKINKELEGRSRTKCTHCGNMTAIKFKDEPPRTWYRSPEHY